MGLDQNFYTDKECNKEILYFRKFNALHSKIGDILDETLLNGKTYRLEREDLEKIRHYIALDGINHYWAFQNDEEDTELPENYLRCLGILTRYIALNKPLFYNADW